MLSPILNNLLKCPRRETKIIKVQQIILSVYVFTLQIFGRWLTFLLRSHAVILTVLCFWIYLFLLTLFVLHWLSLPLGNSDHVVSVVSVCIDFPLLGPPPPLPPPNPIKGGGLMQKWGVATFFITLQFSSITFTVCGGK